MTLTIQFSNGQIIISVWNCFCLILQQTSKWSCLSESIFSWNSGFRSLSFLLGEDHSCSWQKICICFGRGIPPCFQGSTVNAHWRSCLHEIRCLEKVKATKQPDPKLARWPSAVPCSRTYTHWYSISSTAHTAPSQRGPLQWLKQLSNLF